MRLLSLSIRWVFLPYRYSISDFVIFYKPLFPSIFHSVPKNFGRYEPTAAPGKTGMPPPAPSGAGGGMVQAGGPSDPPSEGRDGAGEAGALRRTTSARSI